MNKQQERIAVAFTGPSNSGKTTLITKLSQKLQSLGFKVAIIKHDPKDKARFDTPGKDSYKFSQTGADVAVVSPNKTTILKQNSSTIENIVSSFDYFDFLLVEGLKTLPLPRICIQRDQINSNYFEISDTIATDGSIQIKDLPSNMKILDLNNLDEIIDWIKIYGKVI